MKLYDLNVVLIIIDPLTSQVSKRMQIAQCKDASYLK